MKIILASLLSLALFFARATPALSSDGLQDARDAARTDVDSILGSAGIAALDPILVDARKRLGDAFETVASEHEPPRDVLTFSQKMSVARAMRTGDTPDLALSDEQRAAMKTFFSDLALRVAPIANEDGSRIEAALTSEQRTALAASRMRSLDRVELSAQRYGISDIFESFASHVPTSVGVYVLVVELDLRSITERRR